MDVLEFQIKYKNLIVLFQKEHGGNAIWNNKITKQFKIWLYEKMNRYRRCEICGKKFSNIYYLNAHLWWHKVYDIEAIELPVESEEVVILI